VAPIFLHFGLSSLGVQFALVLNWAGELKCVGRSLLLGLTCCLRVDLQYRTVWFSAIALFGGLSGDALTVCWHFCCISGGAECATCPAQRGVCEAGMAVLLLCLA